MARTSKKDSDPRKAQIDALLLKPGVVGKKINGLDAYFVGDRMFACISGKGIGLRLPIAVCSELQFSRENVWHSSPRVFPALGSGSRSISRTRRITRRTRSSSRRPWIS